MSARTVEVFTAHFFIRAEMIERIEGAGRDVEAPRAAGRARPA